MQLDSSWKSGPSVNSGKLPSGKLPVAPPVQQRPIQTNTRTQLPKSNSNKSTNSKGKTKWIQCSNGRWQKVNVDQGSPIIAA